MEQWEDQAIVLAARPHGESGAVVSLLTAEHGRHAGYVRGAYSSRMRGTLEPGNIVDARWQSRIADQLGSLSVELIKSPASRFLQDGRRLAALKSAAALCDAALPEREGHAGLYHGLLALFEVLEGDHWGPAYVMWEIALLRELGFSLDLKKCAGGGDASDLLYVSPKTGRAVSRAAGQIYKERLLLLPEFLRPLTQALSPGEREGLVKAEDERIKDETEDILLGLKLTGYFLEHWAFAHHTQGLPEARALLLARLSGEPGGRNAVAGV